MEGYVWERLVSETFDRPTGVIPLSPDQNGTHTDTQIHTHSHTHTYVCVHTKVRDTELCVTTQYHPELGPTTCLPFPSPGRSSDISYRRRQTWTERRTHMFTRHRGYHRGPERHRDSW